MNVPSLSPFQRHHRLLLRPLQHDPGDWPVSSVWQDRGIRCMLLGSKQTVAIISVLHIILELETS